MRAASGSSGSEATYLPPPELGLRFLRRIAAPTEAVLLAGAGHLPAEQPGVDQLRDAVHRVLDGLGVPWDDATIRVTGYDPRCST